LEFAAADDVANGGVLLALPALLSEGLLRHTREHYTLQDAAIHQMCILLTETETVFPTTQLRLIYRQVGSS